MSLQDLLECLGDISKLGSPGWTTLDSARNAVVKVREFLSQSDEEGTLGTSPDKNGDVSAAKQRIQATYDDLATIVNEDDDAECDSRLECGCLAASILQEVLHQLQAAECSRILPLPDEEQNVKKVPQAPPNLLSVHQTKVVEGAVRVIVYTVVLGCVGTEASLYLKTTLAKTKFVLGQNLVIVPQGRSLTFLIPTLRLLLPVMKHESLGIGIRRSFFPELFTALLELCFSPSVVKSHREDVTFFREQLEEVMNTTNSATILSHLLFLLGFVPAGSWLGRACRALVVRRFLTRAGGVAAVVGAGLTICGGQDSRCCEAVATIIAHARTRDLNDYYSTVGPQLWDLMQREDLKPEVVRVVVLTVAQLADRSTQLTGQHVTNQLLQPLHQTTLPNAVDVCKGANLTACLSHVHKVFVEIPPPSPALTGLLQSVLSPLVMTAALHTTHLRSSARHIIIRYLSLMSMEDAVDALFIMSSLKMSPESPPMNPDVALAVDDSGGIKVVEQKDLQKTRIMEGDENIARCLISVLELLKNSSVVLLFYERLTKHIDFTVFNKKEKIPNQLLTDDDIRADQFEKMRRILLSCSLLENLSESELVTNDLFMNLSAAVPLVNSLIRIGCQLCEEEQVQQIQASLVMNVLMLVSCYVSERTLRKKMSHEDWKGLQTLLPTLKEVKDMSSDEAVLLLVEQLKNLVLTHGVVSVQPSSLAEAKKSRENSATLYRKKDLCDIAASYDTNFGGNEPIVKKLINNVTQPDMKTNRNDSSKETQKENHKKLETCSDKDNASNKDSHFRTEPNVESKNVIKDKSHLTTESNSNPNSTVENSVDLKPEGDKVNSDKEEGSYQEAMEDLFSPHLPVRGHALLTLGKLLDRRDKEALAHSQQLLSIFQHNLKEDDSYLYLMAVEGLAVLCDVVPEKVVKVLTREFSMGERSGEDRAKLAEAMVRATRRLGPLLPHYRDTFINSLLNGMRAREGMVRAASFSALGDVCRLLKFSLGPVVQEIFCVLYDAVKGDEVPEVRGAAVLVVTLLLQGLGQDTFTVLRDVIRDLYRLLRLVHSTDPDLTVRLHAQVAMEEVDAATRRFLMPRLSLTKRIYVTEMPRTSL